MALTIVFVVLVFLYSLLSRRLERTVATAPIFFTGAGLLIFLMPQWLSDFEVERKSFLVIAELGLVMTLFTDAAHIDLRVLKGNRNLPVRLLSTLAGINLYAKGISALDSGAPDDEAMA